MLVVLCTCALSAGVKVTLIHLCMPTIRPLPHAVPPCPAGYSYLVTIGVGSLIMQIIALVVNNIDPHRRYPTVSLRGHKI